MALFSTLRVLDVPPRAWAALGALLVAVYVVGKKRRARSRLPLPPGPRSKFLLGNLADLPRGPDEWKAFARMGEQYGARASCSDRSRS